MNKIRRWKTIGLILVVGGTWPGGAKVSAQAGASEQGQQPGATKAAQATPFQAGERLDYRVAWGGALTAATARLAVVERRRFYGREVWHFRATAHTRETVRLLYELDDQFDSYTDTVTLESLQFEMYIREQDKKEDTVVRMNAGGDSGQGDGPTVRVLPGTRDALALLYCLRTVDWSKTRQMSTPVFDGKKLYEVRARVVNDTEEVRVPAGTFQASQIELRTYDRGRELSEARFRVWVARDAARTPVKIQAQLAFGELEVELVGR